MRVYVLGEQLANILVFHSDLIHSECRSLSCHCHRSSVLRIVKRFSSLFKLPKKILFFFFLGEKFGRKKNLCVVLIMQLISRGIENLDVSPFFFFFFSFFSVLIFEAEKCILYVRCKWRTNTKILFTPNRPNKIAQGTNGKRNPDCIGELWNDIYWPKIKKNRRYDCATDNKREIRRFFFPATKGKKRFVFFFFALAFSRIGILLRD